ncbi:GMC oxidoreductase, putative [Talaromyces stipitatus ATCC 10500]|uniref:GMC oxidoreductase, putative n=1 Tax=Talaromyces stipitatus (strain ATCC 10500 / CBS 375.48 / QM 6759 / NRRL 1006) TaxID=441959 RepID=B8MJ57_TALSN|nr:GMC oxidoreductase, putative [Talaromyces stipitatus ATCC 10500]EED15719.1 GMC oxidoreductase, putative [Talaromyces stipitatus ATCC 10500]
MSSFKLGLTTLVFVTCTILGTHAQVPQHFNFFDYGQRGPLLGSHFGPPATNATFDYVIAGGGNTGLTIATRLAQTGASVAVIEAGGFYEVDNGNLSIVPGYATFFTGSDLDNYSPLVDWGFAKTPQPELGNRRLHYARGKTLGGSSARNYMLYQRVTVDSMQQWADEVDDQSYTWEAFLPYYQKSINYTPPGQKLYTNSSNKQDPNAFSCTGGPLKVSFSNFVDPFGTWAQQAFIKVNMTEIEGLDSGKLLGSAYATLTIDSRNAWRETSESSFLMHALNAGLPVTIYKSSLARKIIFDSNNTATGVQVFAACFSGTQSMNFTLTARKEVIVSAGVFQSPQLLMVSGIGPCDELADFGITCISNLIGVGQNMQDHPIFGSAHRVNVHTASASLNNATLSALSVQSYINNATGPLSIFGPGIYGWEKLPEPYRSQLSNQSRGVLDIGAYNGYNLNKETADPRDGHNYATLNTALVAPLSRGTVKIQSNSMTEPPIINPNWLADQTDRDLAIQSFKRQREIWDILAHLGSNYTTDSQIKQITAESMNTVYHASATCKMGKKGDPMAVLDSHARVYGVQNLRVVDASSFPYLPPGHPQALVYALAEKVADLIRAQYLHFSAAF